MITTKLFYLIKQIIRKRIHLICSVFLLIGIVSSGLVPTRAVERADTEVVDVPEVCTERGPSSIGAAAAKDRVWKGKTELRVRFLNGSEFLRAQVQHYAKFWSKYANIQFSFVESGPADIRVSFDHDGSSWSYVGVTAKNVAEDQPTMHFGWFVENKTSEVVFRRTILHEFGHALGLVHEHQSPSTPIAWNKAAIYAYYKKQFDWNKNVVDDNFFRKYAKAQTRYTSYDPDSIMIYPIPAQFTLDGNSVAWNTNLSKTDIDFIKKLYPYPSVAGNLLWNCAFEKANWSDERAIQYCLDR